MSPGSSSLIRRSTTSHRTVTYDALMSGGKLSQRSEVIFETFEDSAIARRLVPRKARSGLRIEEGKATREPYYATRQPTSPSLETKMQNQTDIRYRPNAPQVIAETVAGEAMIVNLATGHYFSLQGTGVDIWAEVERERSLSGIIAVLKQRYVAENGAIEAAARRLLGELEDENLIVPVEESGTHHAAATELEGYDSLSANGSRAHPQFVQPVLAKFTDMQDIILLDPVHEVDASGWPHAPTGS